MSPDKFGMFGGGLEEGESIEQGLAREIKEELVYTPRQPAFFSRYEHATHILNVFIEEVGTDFESLVEVREGQYGKFMTLEEIESSKDLTPLVTTVVIQLEEFLSKK